LFWAKPELIVAILKNMGCHVEVRGDYGIHEVTYLATGKV